MLDKLTAEAKKATRDGFGEGMAELGRINEEVISLCADLSGSLKLGTFIKENPDRFYQAGISEANMMGIAAGLATGGKIPYLQVIYYAQKKFSIVTGETLVRCTASKFCARVYCIAQSVKTGEVFTLLTRNV